MTGRAQFFDMIGDAMESCQDVFAEEVTYHPVTGKSYKINAIFDEAAAVIDNSGAVPFESVKPVLGIAVRNLTEANRATPKRGDAVTIRGIKYGIAEIMPDGQSEIRLVLAKGVTRA